LLLCSDPQLSNCAADSANIDVAKGTFQEIQEFVVGSSDFALELFGYSSPIFPKTEEIATIQQKLDEILPFGIISFECASCGSSSIAPGETLRITFESTRGDVPAVIVNEVRRGQSQRVVGQATYRAVLEGLSTLSDWHIRVFSHSKHGAGQPTEASMFPTRTSIMPPSGILNVDVNVVDSTTLIASFDAPRYDGGISVDTFTLEYDTLPTFSSLNGIPMKSIDFAASGADNSICHTVGLSPNHHDFERTKQISISDINLISNAVISPGVELLIEGQLYAVEDVNNCGADCITLDKPFEGSPVPGAKVYVGFETKMYSREVKSLVPGEKYFIRVSATNLYELVGPSIHYGYPNDAKISSPKSAPPPLQHATLRSMSDTQLLVDLTQPPGALPEGANGSPITSYLVEIATGRMGKQKIILTADEQLDKGGFKLSLLGEETGCIDVHDPPDIVEEELQGLPLVNTAEVTILKNLHSFIYEISFDGDFLESHASRELTVIESGCDQFDPALLLVSSDVVERGVGDYRPQVVSILTNADDYIDGHFYISFGFIGSYERLISSNGVIALFEINPRSKIASTSDDLTRVLVPGESIVIDNEIMVIEAITDIEITFHSYHLYGTSGAQVPGYAMDNIIGSASITNGDDLLTDRENKKIGNYVDVGDDIKLHDSSGEAKYFSVKAKTVQSIQLDRKFHGQSTITSIIIRKRSFLSSSVSSGDFKRACESLPDIGSVNVKREGPNSSLGYQWIITFISNGHLTGCPESCLQIHETALNAFDIVGTPPELSATYIEGSYYNGRPQYHSLDSSHTISYDSNGSKWQITGTNGIALSEAISDSPTLPTIGWTNGVVITNVASSPYSLLHGTNNAVTISQIDAGYESNFDNVVHSETISTANSVHEIQEIVVSWTEGSIDGYFTVSHLILTTEVKIFCYDSAEDFGKKLEHLPSVGSVKVTKEVQDLQIKWIVTFLSNMGNVEILHINGSSDIVGVGVAAQSSELVKGLDLSNRINTTIVSTDRPYFVRAAAINEAGMSEFTSLFQGIGNGFEPFSISMMSTPHRSSLSLAVYSTYEVEIMYEDNFEDASNENTYKIEWVPGRTFGTQKRVHFTLKSNIPNDMHGSFQLELKLSAFDDVETSAAIFTDSISVDSLSSTMNGFRLIGSIDVVNLVINDLEISWTLVFTQDVTLEGDFK
jgi:hypothetical protein